LLSLGRKQVFRPQVIDLNQLVFGLEKILRSLIGESLQFSMQLDKNLYNVFADPAQIEQVLINLVLNSRDATEPHGLISIETRNLGAEHDADGRNPSGLQTPHVLISVRDSGCGMDKATQQRMFEPFFTTKEKGKGTGLGLTTVQGIIAQCGGHISVESTPGIGTCMNVHLPRATRSLETAIDSDGPGGETGTETLLVVEDEPEVRRTVCRLLGLYGYRILEASGPTHALELFRQCQPGVDLLLTDVIMPEMNGKELHEKIAELQPGIKVIFMSAYTHGAIDQSGILPEGVNFLQKPFTPEALSSKVRRALDSR
jgi:CheY-like chemotaxis protein